MSHYLSPCPDGPAPSLNARLTRITRATDELARCVAERGRVEPGNEMGLTVGECDWLAELETLLYDEDA